MGNLDKGVFQFRIDTNEFLNEIVECAIPKTQGILKIPLNIFKRKLCEVVERAIQLDDPQLNIIMLEMSLYEVHPNEIVKQIEIQKKRIKNAN
jgi:hypothetical protein